MPSWLNPETSEGQPLYPGMSDGHPLDEEEEEEGMKGSSITALLHLELLGEGGGRVWQVKVSSGGKLVLLQEEELFMMTSSNNL